MINRYRLFMQRLALLATVFLCSTSIALSEESSVPHYYEADTQQQAKQDLLLADPEPSISIAEKNYQLLTSMLPIYENATTHPWPTIPDDVRFKLGRSNAYVPLLRDRLKFTGDLDYSEDTNVFDMQLAEAVKLFQERHGLTADGVIGKNTRAELNVPAEVRLKQLQVNIQRWEALSHKLGQRYVMVNVPDYELYVVENNRQVLSMKAIIGKPTHQTPEVFSKITTVVLKPYWNIPNKIAKNEIIAKEIEDPDYLEKNQRAQKNRHSLPAKLKPYTVCAARWQWR